MLGPKYNPLEHTKLIGTAIERMANNHTKWLLTLFTVIGFAITMDKFIWDLSPLAKLISYISTAVILTTLLFLIFFISKNYFNLELMFRQKQAKVLDGRVSKWDMNPNTETSAKRGSWILRISFAIIILFILSQLAFITIGSLQFVGVI